MIAHGADVHARDGCGDTALHAAGSQADPEIVELLLRAGADVNARGPNGTPPLMTAVCFGHAPVIQALIRAGADVNAANGAGLAALHVAAAVGRPEVLDLLRAAGATADVEKFTGHDLIHVVMEDRRKRQAVASKKRTVRVVPPEGAPEEEPRGEPGAPRGELRIMGRAFPISETKLTMTRRRTDEGLYVELYVHADARAAGGGFLMIDSVELERAATLKQLHGGRIDVSPERRHLFDTLGTECTAEWDTSGWTTSEDPKDFPNCAWGFDRIRVRFKRMRGRTFRVRLKCRLFNWANLETYTKAEAEFLVDAEEYEERYEARGQVGEATHLSRGGGRAEVHGGGCCGSEARD